MSRPLLGKIFSDMVVVTPLDFSSKNLIEFTARTTFQCLSKTFMLLGDALSLVELVNLVHVAVAEQCQILDGGSDVHQGGRS